MRPSYASTRPNLNATANTAPSANKSSERVHSIDGKHVHIAGNKSYTNASINNQSVSTMQRVQSSINLNKQNNGPSQQTIRMSPAVHSNNKSKQHPQNTMTLSPRLLPHPVIATPLNKPTINHVDNVQPRATSPLVKITTS